MCCFDSLAPYPADALSLSHFGHCGICAAALSYMIYGALGRAAAVLHPKTSFYFAEIYVWGIKTRFEINISAGVIPHIADRLRPCKWLLIAFINKKCVLFGQANIGFLATGEVKRERSTGRNINVYCLFSHSNRSELSNLKFWNKNAS